MARPKSNKRRFPTNHVEHNVVRSLDTLAEMDDFEETVLPRLRLLLKASKKLSPEQLYQEFGDILAARVISIALTERDSSKAMTAIKEALDRAHGKAKEKQEITHKYENLKDEELDALLRSKLTEAGYQSSPTSVDEKPKGRSTKLN
jgi:hypothetical protein